MPNISEVEITYKTKVKASEREKVATSQRAFDVLRPFFEDVIEYREKFCVLLLNRQNQVLGVHTISVGGTSSTVADSKIIFQGILLANASAIILAHNHPSGCLRPSDNDKSLTKKIVDGCKLFDISCLDHLIITDESFYSFADQGLMQ
jgi:DNA repair protein RadC